MKKKIAAQFKKKDLDFKWVIETRGAIQKLYAINPKEALKSEKTYMEMSANPKFLKAQKIEEQPK